MTDPNDVKSAYRWILGREPENDTVINDAHNVDLQVLRDTMIGSDEFREYYLKRHMSIFRYVFIRIPKTATTSLLHSLQGSGLRVLEIAGQVPNFSDVFAKHDVASGHCVYGDVIPNLHGVRPIFLSLVRHPVDRVISLYRQATDQHDHPCHADVKGTTLLRALKKEGMFFEWSFNSQCRHLSSHHIFSEVKFVIENELFMICNASNIHVATETISRMSGARLGEITKKNVKPKSSSDLVERQPDFAQARDVIGWLTTEDRKLVDFVGDFYMSPTLRSLGDNKPWMAT